MLMVEVHCPAHSAMFLSAVASAHSSRKRIEISESRASAAAMESPATMPSCFAASLATRTSGRWLALLTTVGDSRASARAKTDSGRSGKYRQVQSTRNPHQRHGIDTLVLLVEESASVLSLRLPPPSR